MFRIADDGVPDTTDSTHDVLIRRNGLVDTRKERQVNNSNLAVSSQPNRSITDEDKVACSTIENN